jgi:hypothetical protein
MKGNFRKKRSFLFGKPVLGNDKLCKVKNSFGLEIIRPNKIKRG